jgi:hypothetical protein
MLANSFKSATDLSLSQDELDALITILYKLESGELQGYQLGTPFTKKSVFMPTFFTDSDCGTVGCLAGWAHLISEGKAFPILRERDHYGRQPIYANKFAASCTIQQRELFRLELEGSMAWRQAVGDGNMDYPSTEQLATALRNYLTTGSMLALDKYRYF